MFIGWQFFSRGNIAFINCIVDAGRVIDLGCRGWLIAIAGIAGRRLRSCRRRVYADRRYAGELLGRVGDGIDCWGWLFSRPSIVAPPN